MAGMIRPAAPADAELLRSIERAAGERFREVGMDHIADDEPPSTSTLASYATAGRSWVAEDEAGRVIGYVLVDVVDGNAHIEQVTVEPGHQGRGVGRSLLEQVEVWAIDRGLPALTLTTFRDVPWNAPLYRHLGFRDVADDDVGPGLRAVRAAEAAHGLDLSTRVCMRREV